MQYLSTYGFRIAARYASAGYFAGVQCTCIWVLPAFRGDGCTLGDAKLPGSPKYTVSSKFLMALSQNRNLCLLLSANGRR